MIEFICIAAYVMIAVFVGGILVGVGWDESEAAWASALWPLSIALGITVGVFYLLYRFGYLIGDVFD